MGRKVKSMKKDETYISLINICLPGSKIQKRFKHFLIDRNSRVYIYIFFLIDQRFSLINCNITKMANYETIKYFVIRKLTEHS